MDINDTLVLRHQPYGEYHPYIPLPYERTPRDPFSGDPVILNVETESNQTVDSVWCEWNEIGSSEIHHENAVLTSKDETLAHWQVVLSAFKGGEVIIYHFGARTGEQSIQGENYSFHVNTWVEVTSLVAVNPVTDQLDIHLATQRQGFDLNITLALEPAGYLSYKLSTNRNEILTKTKIESVYTADWKDFKITLQENPFTLEIKRSSDGLVIKSKLPLQVLVDQNGRVLQYHLEFESPTDEAFYGFGERFNALDQRGNRLDNHVYGQYTSQGKRTYIPVPFFVSSRGYGLWLKTSRQTQFDLAATNPDSWYLEGRAEDDESLELTWFLQPQPYDNVKAFTQVTGRPKVPPAWVFGPWMSSNDWNNQVEVLNQLHETQKLQIPASVLVIEAWSDEINFYVWNDAQYRQKPSSEPCKLSNFKFPRKSRWPDLKAMVDELHQNDVRLVLWQNPTIKFAEQHERLDDTLNQADQAYAIEQGYVVKKTDGTPHRIEAHMPWFQNSLVLDFSNPEAADWWFSKREYIVTELGVDGWKSDGGEHIWDPQTRFFNGMRGIDGINQYPVYYEAAYDRFMQKLRGNDFVLFSRAGYTGSQKYPCHWAGDENSTWDAFRATLSALLNVGLCGLPFVGWDIAGFAGPIPTSELYIRAAAFSVFCPIMQYHSDVNGLERTSRDRTPWNIQKQTGDTRVVPTFRKFANLRMNILPYILNQVQLSSDIGLPLMRVMGLVYPNDPKCRKYDNQYFFGEDLLVAPVIEDGVEDWPVYLPEGIWRDFWTGNILQGPVENKVNVPVDRIPVYQRQGSILPLNLNHSGELCTPVGNSCDHVDDLTLIVFPGSDLQSSMTIMPDSSPLSLEMKSNSDEVDLTLHISASPIDLHLVISTKEPKTVFLNEVLFPRRVDLIGTPSNSEWTWDEQRKEIRVHLIASASNTILK
ncbi:MAG: glycosyl hydrolase 31, partial [Chloroflexi bacterium]